MSLKSNDSLSGSGWGGGVTVSAGSTDSVFKQKQRRSLWVVLEFGWSGRGGVRQERPCVQASSAVFPA